MPQNVEPCALTYLGQGECQECRISFKPKMGQELRLQHTNSQGVFCSSCCLVCRHVEPETVAGNPATDFSEGDGW